MAAERNLDGIAKTAARLKALYTAAVYDIMDEMGLPHQCLHLSIKPIDRTMRIAGPAFTIAAAADIRTDTEYDDFPEVSSFDFFKQMYPGCVVLLAAAGDSQAGHWGELMSTAAKAKGAAGVVIDGGIRDGNLLFDIPDWPVFTRYLSPIESKGRTRIRAIEKPISVSGSLTSLLRVDPGDWIFGDMDGVVVIPAAQVEDVLKKAEEMGDMEDIVREEVKNGAEVADVFKKYGRL
jgi:4-hydroxy-4-methyl-2-oxoglutarate aldolase